MDANQTTHVLNIFAQYSHCFTLEELSNFVDSDSDNETLRQALLADSRFMQLREGDSAEGYFVPKKILFQWFCQLSLRLAQAKQARLNKHQVTILMSSLRIDGRWDTPPTEAIQFGSHFGFIGQAWIPDEYVFPVAHILSFTKFQTLAIRPIIEIFLAGENPHLAFDQLGRKLIQEGLSKFTKRERYVVQEREGLLTGRKMTLQQIGDRLGFSREYIRQIEERFWNKLRRAPIGLYRLFSTALICDLINKQGSLIIPQNSPYALLLSFLAKCTGVPQAIFPDTQLVILGASPKEVASHNKATCFEEEASIDSLYRKGLITYDEFDKWRKNLICEKINVDSIATRLESEMQLCLTYSDLKALAEGIAQFRQKLLTKPLTKGQKAYLALRTIGKPAHCSEITEVYNSLFPDEPSTEQNLHAVLSHEQYGVVWIGIRSTFALKEWGYEHPSIGLFDSVTEIVEERYKETAQPVPFSVVVAEMGKRRQIVNPASLTIAAQCNPRLRRVGKDSFIPKEPSEEMQEEISAGELDRILREFEKESDKRVTEQKLPSTPGKRYPASRFGHALLSLKQKLTSLRS